jgi:hypothetical protein
MGPRSPLLMSLLEACLVPVRVGFHVNAADAVGAPQVDCRSGLAAAQYRQPPEGARLQPLCGFSPIWRHSS